MTTPRDVFAALSDGISEGRFSELSALYAEDTVVEHPQAVPRPTRITGRDAVHERFVGVLAGALRLKRKNVVVHETTDPEVIVAEYDYDAESAETGRTITAANIQVLRIRDGLIVHSRDYHDYLRLAVIRDGVDQLVKAYEQAPPRERLKRTGVGADEHVRVSAREYRGCKRCALPRPQAIAPLRLDHPRAARPAKKDFLEHGLTQQSEQWIAAMRETNQCSPERRARHECARAVDGIDKPCVFGTRRALTLFLGHDSMVRVTLYDRSSENPLDRAVGARDGIERVHALVLDGERAAEVSLRDPARRVREIEREVL